MAQDNFEGKITYKMSFSGEEQRSTIDALFGDQKIKVLVRKTGPTSNDRQDLILDFKNGIFYKITNDGKTYTIDSLKRSKNDIFKSVSSLTPLKDKNAIVLGYKSSAFTVSATEKSEMPFTSPMVTFWYADSLRYKVREEYASVEMVPLFTNGTSVGFGMKLVMRLEENKNDSSEFTVLNIEPEKIPDSLLQLPPGYTLASATRETGDNQEIADSVAMMLRDTIEAIPLKPVIKTVNKPVQKNKKPVKKETTNQSNAPAKKQEN